MKVFRRTLKQVAPIVIVVVGLFLTPAPTVQAEQTDIVGPSGSERFGESVTVLPNGNIVVTDPYYDAGSTTDVGAVFLFDGATGTLISAFTGSTADDQVGYGGVRVLNNGNYVVRSPFWNDGGVAEVGAVTWCDGTAGISGVVSSANSLVGGTAGDRVGSDGVRTLSNGNYVVRSPKWDHGGVQNAGAVTWGDGTTGISGVVSSTNSLVGSTAGDQIGSDGVRVLSSGNYVVRSLGWDNGGATDAGAVTWGNGTSVISGAVSSINSLVGSTTDDQVGSGGVVELSNGNYVVISPNWDNGGMENVGAVTWGHGTLGTSGVVSLANSLVGDTANDQVGYDGVVALSNGNYVVISSWWDNGGATNAGAVTWGHGTIGTNGVVSSANSLVGSSLFDWLGGEGVVALSNGNYVVISPYWDNSGGTSVGAVTWGDGTSGISGEVSSANSLVGFTDHDDVGSGGVVELSNGNYVVLSPEWDNSGATDAGAVTWGDGTSGTSGGVGPTNSLVGDMTNDRVGYDGVVTLSNGNYVVISSLWDNSGAAFAGAVTWGDGTSGTSGAVSSANSLVGSTAYDYVGSGDVVALSNGNYVVCSPEWHNLGAAFAGAVTWGDGTSGTSGAISFSNSLVGSATNHQVGSDGVVELSNGNYVVISSWWHNLGEAYAGAVTWVDGTGGTSGLVSAANSLVGSTALDRVGAYDVVALGNGNYVVISPDWDNGGVVDAGAVTWGDGTSGTSGVVSSTNSLVGGTAGDQVGAYGVAALSDDNYVVISPGWGTGAGAVTWGNGTSGTSGVIDQTNSLVGDTVADEVGDGGVVALSNGSYVVLSPHWDNGGMSDIGAVTWGRAGSGATGYITAANSVWGSTAGGGPEISVAYDEVNDQLVVGRPADNTVTLFAVGYQAVYLPLVLSSY